MLHILHAADLHLDAPFAALTAEQARQRRAEQRQLLDRISDLAVERKADLVLLAGDLLDSRQTYRETVQALAAALGRIHAPVIIAPGNHDFYAPGSPYPSGNWPRNLLIFRENAVRKVELPLCTVYGTAFTGPFRDDSPLAGFHAAVSGKPAVMVCHADVNGTGRYGPLPVRDIAASGLTYLALGHVHTFSGLQREGTVFWAYPGCAEGRGFDELGDKGVLWVTLSDSGGVTAEFVPLAGRRYETISCDLTGRAPEQAVREALATGNRRDICRIVLTGEAENVDVDALKAAGVGLRWALTVRDHTCVPQDLWGREAEDSLTGLFLRDMRRRIDRAGTEDERATLERAVRFGLAALENGDDVP